MFLEEKIILLLVSSPGEKSSMFSGIAETFHIERAQFQAIGFGLNICHVQTVLELFFPWKMLLIKFSRD